MFLDEALKILQQYKESFPHRNIKISGEVNVLLPSEDDAIPQVIKVDLGNLNETTGC